MTRFFASSLSLALIISATAYGGQLAGLFPAPSYTWQIMLYLLISQVVIFLLLQSRPDGLAFTQTYLLSIVLKMATGSIFVLIVIFTDHSGAFGNAALFVVSYFLFTGLELVFLYRRSNRQRS